VCLKIKKNFFFNLILKLWLSNVQKCTILRTCSKKMIEKKNFFKNIQYKMTYTNSTIIFYYYFNTSTV